MIRLFLVGFFLATSISGFSQNESSAAIIEEAATFPGGINKFQRYLRNNLIYPRDAKKLKSKGVVYVEFSIKEDGYVDKGSVRILPLEFAEENSPSDYPKSNMKELPQSCKDEAIRVIRDSPRWIPGKRSGVPIKQRMVIPMRFGRD